MILGNPIGVSRNIRLQNQKETEKNNEKLSKQTHLIARTVLDETVRVATTGRGEDPRRKIRLIYKLPYLGKVLFDLHRAEVRTLIIIYKKEKQR